MKALGSEYTSLLGGRRGGATASSVMCEAIRRRTHLGTAGRAGRTAYVELELLVKGVDWRTRCRTWGRLRGEQESSTQSGEGSGRWFHGGDGASAGPVSA
jgi:hypothetical protein